MPTIEGLNPIIDNNARILILGSMPSTESLRTSEYYANPRNQFWRVIFSIFDSVFETSYVVKTSFLKGNRIALWDVIRSCDREGSSDSKITQVSINDFNSILTTYPKIAHLCFNGQKAFTVFQKGVKLNTSSQITLTVLPSSSPANARMPIEEKIREWAIIKAFLLD